MRLILLLVLLLPLWAHAACGGGSPNWTAASCDDSHVQECIDGASDGDTINVPAGACTFAVTVTIPNTKGVTISCAGSGTGAGDTRITTSADPSINPDLDSDNAPVRITNCRFERAGQETQIRFEGNAFDWRVDNNVFDDNGIATGGYGVNIEVGLKGNENFDNYNYGLIDSNTFTAMRDATSVHINWSRGLTDPEGAAGTWVWSQPAERGTARAVYIEDNTFAGDDCDNCASQVVDTQFAGQAVVRYNDIFNMWISTHSGCTNGGRNTGWTEIYKNRITDGSFPYDGNEVEFRSTSGVIWGNTSVSTVAWVMGVDHERSYRTDCIGDFGARCDGTRAFDENTGGQSGGKCLGQPGWGPEQEDGMSGTGNGYTFAGVFVWENDNNGAAVDISIVNNNPFTSTHLVFGRELWNEDDLVGVGVLASRPSTCTSNASGRDIYIATDQNDQGATIYQCSAADTWTLHWEPYPYPFQEPPDTPTSGLVIILAQLLAAIGVGLLGVFYGKAIARWAGGAAAAARRHVGQAVAARKGRGQGA